MIILRCESSHYFYNVKKLLRYILYALIHEKSNRTIAKIAREYIYGIASLTDTICPVVFYCCSIEVLYYKVLPFLSLQLQFENFLEKLALDSLKMAADEYRQLREEHNQDGAIDELQRRSLEKGLTTHNLKALRESLLRNQTIASRTHHEWQPPEVRDLF